MVYKGFKTTMNWSPEDRVYYGIIENINDFVSYDGKTVEEAHKNFVHSVEDYMEMCKEIGKEPDFK